jgi:glycosyltransferase involved in cell wall biosynthesis
VSVRPTLSVVVPTRDRPELLLRAVRSIYRQSAPVAVECIVVYDQSAPQPIGPLPETPNRSLRCIVNERRPGAAGARNTGILAAMGELIAFCDDDDEWLPHKLERQMPLLESHPSRIVACGLFLESGGKLKERLPAKTTHHRDLLRSRCMELNPDTLMAHRHTFDRVGLFDEEVPGGSAEDYDWFLRATQEHPIQSVVEPLVRVHWDRQSWFAFRWDALADALEYLLAKHPDFASDPAGIGRIRGQVAMARAGAGDRMAARAWARRSLRTAPFQPRAWLALLASHGLVSVDRATRMAAALGRGLV